MWQTLTLIYKSMKEILKKLSGLEPMNVAELEAVRELPAVVLVAVVAVVVAVVLG